MALSPGATLGPYEVIHAIGAGGMGEVYRARDTRLKRDVAIKVLPPAVADNLTRRARFAREAQSISQLSHPHICTIHDIGDENGVTYLVMEFIDGESLEKRLRRGPLGWATALEWATQIAGAIDAAHRRGIVHRDLKPANIMVADSGIKLLDFGLAKLLEPVDTGANQSTESITAEQKLVGTLHYMSPEQLEGRPVDTRTDLFAFGVTLYEMVTGRKAFTGTTAASITTAILTADPAPVSATGDGTVPPAIDHIIRRALAKDPDERWQTARDVMLELRWIQEGRSRGIPGSALVRRRWTWLALAAGGIILTVTAAAAGWWLGLRQRGPSTIAPIVFTVNPPPGTQFGATLAVSPDGHKIAFIAGPEGGTPGLWWQSLDSAVAHPLLGTENAAQPFWSPDSAAIGYNAGSEFRQLRRVSIADGKIGVIANRPGTQAAYWSSDGTVLFQQPDGLYRVSANGGEPVRVRSAGQFPGGLPDGRFQYFVWVNSSRDSGLRIDGPGLAAPVTLPTVQSNAVYAAGYLVFRQGSSLVAQAFDSRALRFTETTPTPLAEGVAFNPASLRTWFDASADVLAFRPEAARKLTWKDRRGRVQGSVGEVGTDWNPAIAPDGQRVALDRFDPHTNGFHIWTIDDHGRAAQITHGLKERFPVWSVDGQWIAYWSLGTSSPELRRTSADGKSGEQVLVKGKGLFGPQDFSKDGLVVYNAANDQSVQRSDDLFAIPLAGGAPVSLTNTPSIVETRARISADGRWIAYVSDEAGPARRDIWVMEFPSGHSKRMLTADGGMDPSWRDDGKEIFYVAPDNSLMAVPVTVSGGELTFGRRQLLFKFDPGGYSLSPPIRLYSASPDGQRFLVTERSTAPPVITVIAHWPSMVRRP